MTAVFSCLVPCLLQTPPPLSDPLPNSPIYLTSCSIILKHTVMSLTGLSNDLLQNVSHTKPPPASDINTLAPGGILHT